MSLKIEKMGLFAIKEKTGARMRTVSPHVHTYVHTRVRTLSRAVAFAAAAEISRRKTRGAMYQDAHAEFSSFELV